MKGRVSVLGVPRLRGRSTLRTKPFRTKPVGARRRSTAVLAAAGVMAFGAVACGGDDESGAATGQVTVYSGRSEALVRPVLDQFTEATGIEVEARFGNTAQLAAQLLEEGDRSPADVFFAQDAGALGAVTNEGLFSTLPEQTLALVPAQFQSATGEWVGVTARARVLVYNSDAVPAAELPESVFELTDPSWRGRVGVAPTNASFQAFVTAMVVVHGEERTREFLAGLAANEPQIRDGNVAVLEDVDAGTIDVGLINHYYVGELAAERGVGPDELTAQLHFFPGGDIGALVNVAGVGVLETAAENPDAQALVDYLLSEDAQAYFAEQTFEYPVVEGVAGPAGLPALDELTAPEVDLNDLDALDATIALIQESGLTP